ncbi:hypothetical protein GCM10023208_34180 [Erythrobacter westpacificensis]|uniref:Rieske domain-containing protein n=1 Tax=Erythrobacter westpacificensis TaxID=1055231 RepID=A0ABP9KPH9_9SPHN
MNESTKISPEPKTYEDLLKADTHRVPDYLMVTGEQEFGPDEVPISWVLDRNVHEQEIEKLWKKSWQMACRMEDLREVGDTFVYEVATLSFVIVRSSETEIKAFYNSCLHRGRPLRTCAGHVSQLKCPYHGFTWSLDGELRGVPAREEFPTVNRDSFRLPQVQVATWGGFVFLNPDPDAVPFDEYIGTMPREFDRMPLDNRVKAVHVSKVLNCNWKIAQDAFLEAFHVLTTHPQIVLAYGDQFHRLEVFENYSRGALGSFHPSKHVRWKPSAQEILNAGSGAWDDMPPLAEVPDDTDLRAAVAAMNREQARPELGDMVDELSDAELVDIHWISLFPNFNPFPHALANYIYRFRPNGDDHRTSIFDVMLLLPDTGEQPIPVAKEKRLGPDEEFTDAPEMGFIAGVLNQDVANLEEITKGLRNNQRGTMVLAGHHELKLRHFYKLYADQMGFETDA